MFNCPPLKVSMQVSLSPLNSKQQGTDVLMLWDILTIYSLNDLFKPFPKSSSVSLGSLWRAAGAGLCCKTSPVPV